MSDPRWIRFHELAPSPSGKTTVWAVESHDGAYLGKVKWFGRWRRYAFFPFLETVFEQDCLRDIAAFVEE